MAAKKIKDTDYLYLSAYVHAKENTIIGKDRIDRMLEARSPQDALKILEDAGWQIPEQCTPAALDGILAQRRDEVFADMAGLAPNAALVDSFRIRYDYHNAKCLVKAASSAADVSALMSGAGRVAAKTLRECFLEGKSEGLPKPLAAAMTEAADVLARTGDPQLADFTLDKACYAELVETAARSGSPFLTGYTALTVDSANLRSLVRALRMKKDEGFLRYALMEGGSVKKEEILAALEEPERALELFARSGMAGAVEQAKAALAGGGLTALEKQCDDLLNAYLSEAKLVPFGEKPLLAYLGAVEAEISAVRIVMTGQFAGIPAEAIRRRLREGV